jgi:hypothetical protein
MKELAAGSAQHNTVALAPTPAQLAGRQWTIRGCISAEKLVFSGF